LAGLAFFIMMSLAGDYLSLRFALPIPGSILGLGMALCVLAIRGKVDEPLKSSAATLLRYLPVMLVPLGVGVVKLMDDPPSGLWRLMMVLVLSMVVGVIGTAKIMEGFLSWQDRQAATTPPAMPESADCTHPDEA
jgi:holin-like protein